MGGFDRRGLLGALGALPFASAAQAGLAGLAPARRRVAESVKPAEGRRVSLTIGVDAYRHLDPLKRAGADANAMHARLTALGYGGATCLNPDRARFEDEIEAFVGRIDPESSVVLFYAGHGFQAGGSNYLTSIETSGNAEALFPSSIELAPLLSRISAKTPRQAMIVLDACREFPWIPGGAGQRVGFSSIQAPGGFYIVYAAGSGELALDDLGDSDPHPNSVFTRAFLKQLHPNVSMDMAVKSTRAEVTCLAATVNHPQHPAIYDQSTEELTLAGEPLRTRLSPPGAGRLDRTLVLIVAQEGSKSARLRAPPEDLKLVGSAFRSLGAEVRSALNPDLATVERMLDEAARAPQFDQVVVYWSGNGCHAGPADAAEAMFMIRIDDHQEAIVALTLAEMVRRLRAPGRRNILLADMCLDNRPASSFVAPGPGDRNSLTVLLRGDDASKRDDFGEFAALFATTFGAISQDTAEGAVHSPFAGAVANALSRPGLSLRDFATVVKNEVEDLTDGTQSPGLFGVRDVFHRPFVQPRGCAAVKA